ncbi:MAG: DNA methyltransferase [Solirubrobacteraceae bacterium]
MQRRSACAPGKKWRIIEADCFEALPRLAANSIDSIITDPPYGIGACGREWDRPARLAAACTSSRKRPSGAPPNERFQAFSRAWASACLPALKPGGHLAAFAAPRTFHRLTCGLEEAGYEVRDVLMWLQGQGYPATRVLPDGLGTGLKPAWEPIVLARKPLHRSLTDNLAIHRTGALRIDDCRIALAQDESPAARRAKGEGSQQAPPAAGRRTCCSLTTQRVAPRNASRAAQSASSATGSASSTPPRRHAASARQAARSCPAASFRPTRSANATNSSAPKTPSPTSTQPSSRSR